HYETRCAHATLQRRIFKKSSLQRMHCTAARNALDGCDLAALGLHTQHQTGGNDAVIEQNRAGAAIAIITALFGTGQSQDVAQAFEQALARLAKELLRFAVNGGLNASGGWHSFSWSSAPLEPQLPTRGALERPPGGFDIPPCRACPKSAAPPG